jgi:hypothetical protein
VHVMIMDQVGACRPHARASSSNPTCCCVMLQVFMHVLSSSKSRKRFGNYKDAHKLDKSDPLWLHAKEVDKAKVVLCRYIKSQLTGQSLINALDKAKDVTKPAPLTFSQADVRAAKTRRRL